MNTPNRALFVPASLTPTAEQRDIQLSQHKVSLVHANAGAAKTTTLALRVGEALARGVAAEQILALTFTPEAKQVMKARLQDVGVAYSTVSRLHVLTLDEFAEHVLAGIEDGKPLQLQTARDLKLPALDALENLSSRYAHKADLLEIRTHDTAVSQFLDALLRLKARMVLDQDDTGMALEYVAEDLGVSLTDYLWAREYETLRLGSFEDLQFRGPFDATYDLARLLRDHPETRTVLPAYRLVVGDELHDLNEASFTVLQALLDCDGLYFVGAGDRDQVIHSQLGADEKYLDHRFGDHFPGNARYPLTTTFRHGPHLAYAIEAFKRKPVRSSLPTTTQLVESWYDETPGGCADRVVEALKQWKTQKHPLEACAILLRDRHQSAEIENALMQANIGYRTQSMPSYLRREEILFLRGMLAVALGNLHMVKAETIRADIVESLAIFAEVPMTPKELEQSRAEVAKYPEMLRHFFEGQIQRVGAAAARTRISDAVAYVQGLAPDTPAYLALREICDRVGMQALAKRLYVHPYDASVIAKSVDGFIAMANASGKSLRDFSDWIGAADEFVASRKSKNLVLIESVTHAKGKEFEHVILPFLETGEFPNPLKDPREEENLFYVAATRAQTRLTLIAPVAQEKRSPFIDRMAIASTRSRADAAVRINASQLQQQRPAITRQDLKVSYADKDVVKAMGAQWDATRKVWYVREGLDVEPFRAWIPKT